MEAHDQVVLCHIVQADPGALPGARQDRAHLLLQAFPQCRRSAVSLRTDAKLNEVEGTLDG